MLFPLMTFFSGTLLISVFGTLYFSVYNLPVAWIQDKNTTVYIDLFESDEFGQICVLKFAYELELSEL